MSRLLGTLFKRYTTVSRLSKGFGISSIRFMARYGWLAKVRGFSEGEILSLALMDPAINFRDLRQYQAKKDARPVYRLLNASQSRELIDDKDHFHKACDVKGMASVPVIMRLTREGLSELRQEIENGRLRRYTELLIELPDRFVVKPSLGYHGDGILFLKKKDSQTITDWHGDALLPRAFVKALEDSISAPTMPLVQGAKHTETRRSPDKHVLLVQPLLNAHKSLQILSGRDQVQSLRICTVVDKEGTARIHFAFLKLLAGTNMQDNFAQGSNGNMLAYMDRESGRINRVIGRDPTSGLMRVSSCHPDTGNPFYGFEVPFWRPACELALQAARHFSGTGAVGWDIGLTPDGPMLLEGNGTWDPLAPLYEPFPRKSELSRESAVENKLVAN